MTQISEALQKELMHFKENYYISLTPEESLACVKNILDLKEKESLSWTDLNYDKIHCDDDLPFIIFLLVGMAGVGSPGASSKQAHQMQYECIKECLDRGANPNASSAKGYHALHLCGSVNNEKVSGLLLEHGAMVDATDQFGRTPLNWLVQNKNDINHHLQLLLSHGADANKTDDHNVTILYRMMGKAWTDNPYLDASIKIMFEHGADFRKKSRSVSTLEALKDSDFMEATYQWVLGAELAKREKLSLESVSLKVEAGPKSDPSASEAKPQGEGLVTGCQPEVKSPRKGAL